jgi:hypothetical protein
MNQSALKNSRFSCLDEGMIGDAEGKQGGAKRTKRTSAMR